MEDIYQGWAATENARYTHVAEQFFIPGFFTGTLLPWAKFAHLGSL